MHPLEHPLIWFGLQVIELAVVVPALLFGVPDLGVWPEGLRVAAWAVALIDLTLFNFTIRRHLIPRDASAAPAGQLGSDY